MVVHRRVGLRDLLGDVVDQTTQLGDGLDQKSTLTARQTAGFRNNLAAPSLFQRSCSIRDVEGPRNQEVQVALRRTTFHYEERRYRVQTTNPNGGTGPGGPQRRLQKAADVYRITGDEGGGIPALGVVLELPQRLPGYVFGTGAVGARFGRATKVNRTKPLGIEAGVELVIDPVNGLEASWMKRSRVMAVVRGHRLAKKEGEEVVETYKQA